MPRRPRRPRPAARAAALAALAGAGTAFAPQLPQRAPGGRNWSKKMVGPISQAMVSAVVEPIGNRVLVLRVKVIQAIKESQPSAMLRFFKTTLVTNLLQLPLFEAVLALASAFPVPATLQGTFTGFVFATVTLPIMNIRYRKSMQLPVHLSNIYEAYIPTVLDLRKRLLLARDRGWEHFRSEWIAMMQRCGLSRRKRLQEPAQMVDVAHHRACAKKVKVGSKRRLLRAQLPSPELQLQRTLRAVRSAEVALARTARCAARSAHGAKKPRKEMSLSAAEIRVSSP